MLARPVIITESSAIPSKTIKRTLFRVSLVIGMIGSVLVSAILFLQGGLALGQLRYFIDIGQHPLHITSVFLLIFGFLSILTFIILTIGLIKVKRNYAIIATGLLIICALGLLIFSIWSFATLASEQLPKSINNTLIKEIDQTQYNNTIANNTIKMAKLEKQHQCCGVSDPVTEYNSRNPNTGASSTSRGRPTTTPRYPPVLLPISCCNEKFYSKDTNLCDDINGNNPNPITRYNTDGCYSVIIKEKYQNIQQQGITTIVAGTLAVISCIALASVIKLLGEGFQVVPIRTAT